jgi:lipopolysaccharide export system permease protein
VRIIHRYVLREIAVPFVLGLATFTFILLIARVLRLVELVVNRGVPLLDVLRLFSYILPAFLEVTVPMALLLGVLTAFGRLSADSEITALRTSGVSLYQVLSPVAVFASVVFVIALGLSVYVRPWGNNRLRAGLFEIARTRAGFLVSGADGDTLTLRLIDGSIHTYYPHNGSYHRTDFATYDVTLDLQTALGNLEQHEKDASEMTVGELRTAIAAKGRRGEPAFDETVELHRKLSIPFACLVFAALGVPLGIQPSRAVHSRGFTLSLGLILVYYLLLTLGESLGSRGIVPAVVGLWFPNVLLSTLATVLIVRAANDRPAGMLSGVGGRATWLRSRVRRWAQASRH